MELQESLKKIIENARSEITKQSALNIINSHMGTPSKLAPTSFQPSRPSQTSVPIKSRINLIPEHQLLFFKYLFKEKFNYSVSNSKANESFQQFAFRVYNKNKTHTKLDLSDLYIKITDLNRLDQQLGHYNRINLSSNLLHFESLQGLFHPNICSIILSNCGLNDKTLGYLFQRLVGTNITHLCLSSKTLENKNRLTNPTQLYKLIQSSQTLTILELADIGLDSQHSQDLFELLRNSTVISVDLSMNEGVVGVGKDIEMLVLRSNKIRNLRGVSFKECRFQVLDLSFNALEVRQMESLFKNQILSIQHLVLDHNPLGSLDLLEKFLIEKAHVKSLSLRKCSLEDDAIKSLFSGLEMNNSAETLDISQNPISKQAGKIIAEFVRKLKLRSLNLSQCDIWDESGELIGKQLTENKRLNCLNLSQNKLSQLTGSALALALRVNRCITTLKISENTIPYKFLREIKQWVEFNAFSSKEGPQPRSNTTEEEYILQQANQLSLEKLERRRNELETDIKRLSGENTKLTNNKQSFDQLEEVFSFIDNQGNEKINKLMDELDEIQAQINEQKEIKIEVLRKSLTPSHN